MKKLLLFIIIFNCIILSACNAINYTKEAIDYTNDLTQFYAIAPILIPSAVSNEEKRAELEEELLELKDDIEEFNALTPPDSIADTHNKIVLINNELLKTIDTILPHVEKGTLTKQMADAFKINEQIGKIKNLVEDIKNFQN